MAQRLCRKLCPICKIEALANNKQIKSITNILGSMISNNKKTRFKPSNSYRIFSPNKSGCDACHYGYKGRVGLFEGIVMNRKVENVAISGGERDVAEAAEDQGMPTLSEDGIIKILEGITSYEEISSVVDLYI